MMKQFLLAGSLVILMLNGVAQAEPDVTGGEIKTHEVKPGIYLLEGKGGNIGLSIGEDGVLMIDDQFEGLSAQVQAAIENLGGSEPDFVINTHFHHDHTGANVVFGRTGRVLAHTNVRSRLISGFEVKTFNTVVGPAPQEALPVITYDQGVSLHFNGEEIKVWHLPTGHTDGDSVVLFTESNVVHMGDLMFAGMFPFIDLINGGDVEGYVRNVGTVINAIDANTRVIPGHGALSAYDALKAWHAMLKTSVDFVKDQKLQGIVLSEVNPEDHPKVWKDYADGFINTDQWLETLYTSVKQ